MIERTLLCSPTPQVNSNCLPSSTVSGGGVNTVHVTIYHTGIWDMMPSGVVVSGQYYSVLFALLGAAVVSLTINSTGKFKPF